LVESLEESVLPFRKISLPINAFEADAQQIYHRFFSGGWFIQSLELMIGRHIRAHVWESGVWHGFKNGRVGMRLAARMIRSRFDERFFSPT
jgi:hypothetical protein